MTCPSNSIEVPAQALKLKLSIESMNEIVIDHVFNNHVFNKNKLFHVFTYL